MFITIILLRGAEIQSRFPDIVRNISGIHPETCLDPVNNFENFTEEFHKYYDQQLAVGETGLDFLAIQDHAQRDRTAAIFRQVLGFAVEIQKSVVIHCRNAEKQTLQILEEFPDLPGVLLHCFGGPEKFIQRGLQNGWYFTIPTSIAFKKIHQDLARMVPLGRILLETDSPFLAPSPENAINEPSNVVELVRQIAEVKNCSEEEVAEATFTNTHQFFNF